jgi:hypothetical protein
MSEDLHVDHDRQHPPDDADRDLDTTTVRPALADDLLAAPAYDDDELTDDELLAPGGQRPSRLTRFLLALLICAVGVFIGVQVARLAGVGSSARAAAGSSQSRRFGPPGAAASGTGTGTAAPRQGLGSSAPVASGEISAVQAHSLVLLDQGARQSVTFTDDTTVTAPYAHARLVKGDAVSVFGSRAADGSVNATSIVVR